MTRFARILNWLLYEAGVAHHQTTWPNLTPARITHYQSKEPS